MIDWALAFAAVLFAGGLAAVTVVTVPALLDRLEVRLVEDAPDDEPDPDDREACGVPTFDTERCGLLAGHADRRHLSWPSGLPYPPDDEVVPPVVPRERLYAVGGWVDIGGRRVHRSCNEDRRDGRHYRVCAVCADRLGMAPTGGAS